MRLDDFDLFDHEVGPFASCVQKGRLAPASITADNPTVLKSAVFGDTDTAAFAANPGNSVDSILREHVLGNSHPDAAEDPIFVADLGEVHRQHVRWKKLLPRVEPFYAVKCNPNRRVIKLLAELGAGFDCASKSEVQMTLQEGKVAPTRIIYANPCKQVSHIRYAVEAGVQMMTFDNHDELVKIKQVAPHARLVLRILTDDSKSLCKLGTKFGASLESTESLLAFAKELKLNVVGVSFHVGSGCYSAAAFGDAVLRARRVFDQAAECGYNMTLLDVGGGFPGNNVKEGVKFPEIAAVLAPAIDEHFPKSVRVIAEPGRYYVSSAFTLAVNVTARRTVDRNKTPEGTEKVGERDPSFMYYINDGVYGSFNCLMFDHATVYPIVLCRNGAWRSESANHVKGEEEGPQYNCSIWGPTCDSIDCIAKEEKLPELNVGDWLCFENMGAYTMCAASDFNGFKKTEITYTNTETSAAKYL